MSVSLGAAAVRGSDCAPVSVLLRELLLRHREKRQPGAFKTSSADAAVMLIAATAGTPCRRASRRTAPLGRGRGARRECVNRGG